MNFDIFEYLDFRQFLADWIQSQPRRGYGQNRKMAEHLGVSSVMMSQILKGDRLMPMEHAYELARYIGLNDNETRYFLLLAQHSRAGTESFKKHLKDEIQSLRKSARELKSRLPVDKELSDEAKSIFYSDWIYSGVRLVSSIEGFESVEKIAEKFDLPIQKVRAVAEFLVSVGLCVQNGGKLQMGPARTHLESNSPYVKARQVSWRLKGFEQMGNSTDDLYYTAPMALSKEAAEEVRKQLVLLIQRVNKIVPESKSEELACLNIDWFKF